MVITDASQVDRAWIDRALHSAGVTRAGDVISIELDDGEGRAWSRILRIKVRYRVATVGNPPPRLLLKLCSDESETFGSSEVDFYRRDYADAADLPIPRCFHAAYSERPRRYHLLLEDLSATHTNADEVTPDEEFGRSLAQSLAALHSHRWGAEGLRSLSRAVPAGDEIDAYVGHVRKGLEPMLAVAADTLGSKWPSRLRSLFEDMSDVYAKRALATKGMALLHGDLNPGNLLVPRSRRGPILLIDRQPFDWSLTRWLAVSDLALAMVPWWDTDIRRRLEPMVLEHYGASLRARGVTDYPMSEIREDYRLCLAMALAVPVQWCILEADRERMRWLWSIQLQRALAAFDDVGGACW
jgi:thiamine kinase-like enzyme